MKRAYKTVYEDTYKLHAKYGRVPATQRDEAYWENLLDEVHACDQIYPDPFARELLVAVMNDLGRDRPAPGGGTFAVSASSRAAITRGILEGENPFKLLDQAVECIGRMTGDNLFREQARENVKAVYGAGLLEPIPLEMELADVRKRLALLTRPELDGIQGDERRRLDNAIRAHRAREERILKMLEKDYEQ